MQKSYKSLIVKEIENSVVSVLFNRPETANALNSAMAMDIKDFFNAMAESSWRAVILTGQGKHFCAGADLKERKGLNDAQWHDQHHAFENALHAIMECPVPVIAAVNGAAYGGGLELALACDFIYAAETARFALSETTLGIIPGLGGTQTLPRAIGVRRAKELIYLGRAFTAQEAWQWGMVNRVCTHTSLLDEVLACARTISANAPLAVQCAKRSIREGLELPLPQALQCELVHYDTLLSTRDRHEGINAFNEKRKPVFTGE